MASTSTLSDTEKAALLVLCMDEEVTGTLFQKLQDEEIEKVGAALMRMKKIPAAQLGAVIEEFMGEFAPQGIAAAAGEGQIQIDGQKVADKLIRKSMPPERCQQLLDHMVKMNAQSPDESGRALRGILSTYSVDPLFELLKNEHPQMIALTLTHARRKVIKGVLEKFEDELRVDVLDRMARLQEVSGNMIDDIKEFIDQQKAASEGSDESAVEETAVQTVPISGMDEALKLLKSLARAQAMELIAELEKKDAELAQQISDQMLTIEDFSRADDAGMRELLKGVSQDDLKLALKDLPESVQNRFFDNMSERASLMLREDMEVMAAIKAEEQEAAQKNIIGIAKELIKEEKIQLAELEEDDEDM